MLIACVCLVLGIDSMYVVYVLFMFVVVLDYGSFYARVLVFFFFQAEDGIRDAQESRGLGDVYKRQC